MNETASTYREKAGVILSGMIIGMMLASDPIRLVTQAFTGSTVAFDPTWAATVAGMAGTALGYVIGKQTTNQPATTTISSTPTTVTTTVTPEGQNT